MPEQQPARPAGNEPASLNQADPHVPPGAITDIGGTPDKTVTPGAITDQATGHQSPGEK